jgi:hypothetical protein
MKTDPHLDTERLIQQFDSIVASLREWSFHFAQSSRNAVAPLKIDDDIVWDGGRGRVTAIGWVDQDFLYHVRIDGSEEPRVALVTAADNPRLA